MQTPDDDAESSRVKDVIDRAPGEAADLKETALGRGSEAKLTEVQERWENRLACASADRADQSLVAHQLARDRLQRA